VAHNLPQTCAGACHEDISITPDFRSDTSLRDCFAAGGRVPFGRRGSCARSCAAQMHSSRQAYAIQTLQDPRSAGRTVCNSCHVDNDGRDQACLIIFSDDSVSLENETAMLFGFCRPTCGQLFLNSIEGGSNCG
jgi:hypothetical protein